MGEISTGKREWITLNGGQENNGPRSRLRTRKAMSTDFAREEPHQRG